MNFRDLMRFGQMNRYPKTSFPMIGVSMGAWAHDTMTSRYAADVSIMDGFKSKTRKETWNEIAHRVAWEVGSAIGMSAEMMTEIEYLIVTRKFIPGGRYLYSAGRAYHQVNNCLLLKAHDTREGWGDLGRRSILASMTGAGIGVWYGDLREEGAKLVRAGGVSSGPLAAMHIVNENARSARQGGGRRGAVWAGLPWTHPDIMKFVHVKNWSPSIRAAKAADQNAHAPLDCTNISVGLDDEFFLAYRDPTHEKHALAHRVYWSTVRQMLSTGEPGFSVNCGENKHEVLRNACTEVTSCDDNDVCNLGSINLARINGVNELQGVVELATCFLIAGSVYSDVPYPEVGETRDRNRRLGLGLMGLHEWLIKRGKKYGPDDELTKWLSVYAKSTDFAHRFADEKGLSRPIKTRAVAPVGTIGVIGETTTGIEPIFAVATMRRYRHMEEGRDEWRRRYYIDPTARRLIDAGVDPSSIEQAYDLANDVERRVMFQSYVQRFVDHGISSTINLPEWGSSNNNESTVHKFGEMLMRYLPTLRGITVYPDGARDGQPLTAVSYDEAMSWGDKVITEGVDICDLTRGESCGS